MPVAVLQLAAGDRAVAGLGDQHPASGAAHRVRDHARVGALAVEDVGLGRPTGAAGVAAVGRLDERDERRDVGGVAERKVKFGVLTGGTLAPGGDAPAPLAGCAANPGCLVSRICG